MAKGGRSAVRRAQVPPWGLTATREEARQHVQARIGLFTRLWFWLAITLITFVTWLYSTYPSTRPAGTEIIHPVAVAALAGLAVVWHAARKSTRISIEALYAID